MTQPELRTALLGEDEGNGAPPSITSDERFLFRHLAAVAALLIDQPDAYRSLRARRGAEEPSEEVRAIAHDQAERAATVLQSMHRRQDLIVAAQDTPFRPSEALAVLNQLFFSFCLLSGPDDDLVEAALDGEAASALLEALDVNQWLEQFA